MENNELLTGIYSKIISQGNIALEELEKISLNGKQYIDNMLIKLLEDNKETVYGKLHNFENIKSYEEYKNNIPLQTFEDFRSLVSRITENGEQNVLTKKEVVQFCPTSGTTSGPKYIPIIQDSINLSNRYTLPACIALVDKALKEKGYSGFGGRGIFNLEIGSFGSTKSGIPVGGISGTSVKGSNSILDIISTSPREVITPDGYIDGKYVNLLFALREKDLAWWMSCYTTPLAGMIDLLEIRWQDLCDDIENGCIHDDVDMSDKTRESLNSKLTPNKERANELREIFKVGLYDGILSKVWPNFLAVAAIGTGSFKIHTDKIKRCFNNNIVFCNCVISSSETLMAIVDKCDSESFVLIPQTAFFEFIPENEPVENIKNANELEVGKKYEVVVSTISGLYRYRIYDVVEVVGFYNQLPMFRFSHRANVFLNVAGEKTTEADMLRAVRYFENKTGIKVAEFCAYANMEEEPGKYEFLLEPQDKMDTSKIVEYEKIIDEGFCETFTYKYERQAGNLLPVHLSLQQRQTHLLYRELQIMKGTNPNQLKPVRILNNEEKKAFFTKMIKLREKIR